MCGDYFVQVALEQAYDGKAVHLVRLGLRYLPDGRRAVVPDPLYIRVVRLVADERRTFIDLVGRITSAGKPEIQRLVVWHPDEEHGVMDLAELPKQSDVRRWTKVGMELAVTFSMDGDTLQPRLPTEQQQVLDRLLAADMVRDLPPRQGRSGPMGLTPDDQEAVIRLYFENGCTYAVIAEQFRSPRPSRSGERVSISAIGRIIRAEKARRKSQEEGDQ